MRALIGLIYGCLGLTAWVTGAPPPHWPLAYQVMGTISIPFAEIEEPFAAFFDAQKGQSRIDYYGGMDRTFQRRDIGDFGTSFKIVPMADDHLSNAIRCFQTNGSQAEPIEPQAILPDLAEFEFKGDDLVEGVTCQKWQRLVKFDHKVNKYTMWIRMLGSPLDPTLGVPVPVRYEMKGFNSLLGSHFDHYYLVYMNYSPEAPASRIFDEYTKYGACTGWPGPGVAHEVYVMNPAKEFVDPHDGHVDAAFDHFKMHHDKTYDNEKDHDNRKDIFRQNMRYIHSKNRAGLSYKLESNHLSDWTSSEMKMLRGKLYTPGYNGGQAFTYTAHESASAPDALDWRLYGAVSPVKDQSICGSCWSFGTAGTLEGTLFLQTGEMIRLSQQSLMDCSWGFGNNGCDGGEDYRVYKFMMAHGGIPSEEDYGPYLGADGYCHFKDIPKKYLPISGYVNVTSGDNEALRVALAKHGPISVSIDASHKSLSFYSSGVYYEPKCTSVEEGLDHSVLAVGYGEMNGEKYWLIKNSWSTHWGNDGYILMSQKDNNCGVATGPTFVIPKQ
ncbi:digestive cysteine proteinase 2-like [Tigriopus californicus]|uniref:digestive cysteine proteinase 2-like n=1 Tax=Tigriopus californicus TaxID=6832 RepID=UPI0027DA3C68|nr:digestive cysteine proteinase 2-like [Tigriopus californicus]